MKPSDRIGIVVGMFESEIADTLLQSALTEIKEQGGTPELAEVIRVPGAYEIPSGLNMLIQKGGHSAYVALGCVIRGETTHYDVVVNECARGCTDLVREFTVPFGFGIITANTEAQAVARAGSDRCMGRLAMRAALQMAALKQTLLGE